MLQYNLAVSYPVDDNLFHLLPSQPLEGCFKNKGDAEMIAGNDRGTDRSAMDFFDHTTEGGAFFNNARQVIGIGKALGPFRLDTNGIVSI